MRKSNRVEILQKVTMCWRAAIEPAAAVGAVVVAVAAAVDAVAVADDH